MCIPKAQVRPGFPLRSLPIYRRPRCQNAGRGAVHLLGPSLSQEKWQAVSMLWKHLSQRLCAYLDSQVARGRLRPVKTDLAASLMTRTLLSSIGGRVPGRLAHILPSTQEQADFILYDPLCLWARIVSQVLHIPAILLCPTYVQNEHSHFMQKQPAFMQSQSPGMFDDIQSAINDLCTLYHIPPLDPGDFFTHTEALNIVFMPRAFQPAGETFDERFVFVGPSILPRKGTPAFPLQRLEGQPTLLISLGTAFNNRPDFFKLCLHAFGHQPWQVVLAHGKHVDLGAVPQNFLLAPYVPQLEVLQRTSVFVTHGGMNSVMESLYFGVPVVVVPQIIEQEVTAQRCAELGLGIALNNADLSVEALQAAVEQVHHTPTFREHVQAMQQTVRAAG